MKIIKRKTPNNERKLMLYGTIMIVKCEVKILNKEQQKRTLK